MMMMLGKDSAAADTATHHDAMSTAGNAIGGIVLKLMQLTLGPTETHSHTAKPIVYHSRRARSGRRFPIAVIACHADRDLQIGCHAERDLQVQ